MKTNNILPYEGSKQQMENMHMNTAHIVNTK